MKTERRRFVSGLGSGQMKLSREISKRDGEYGK